MSQVLSECDKLKVENLTVVDPDRSEYLGGGGYGDVLKADVNHDGKIKTVRNIADHKPQDTEVSHMISKAGSPGHPLKPELIFDTLG